MSASVKPGDVLAGKYRVERILGAGGMGYVVAARHLQLDQLVAMKFLRREAIDDQEATVRFLREAKAVVKLRNEHVAKVFDVGTMETGEPYIVMEHLDGCDLAALAKQRHTIPVAEASEYVMQACEALAEAHALGIVHRDIKLANLFVTRGPVGTPLVKVLDFGISKTNPFGESEHDMTRTTAVLGSPRFMSPEQMRDARAVDGRSDIWSLGVVLYRLVGGHPPFEANTLGQLFTVVMHERETPLSSIRGDLPPGFEQVVLRCLQKDPAMRFANVAELAYALVPFSVDPVHAQATADRIAAILMVPKKSSTSISMPMGSGRPSSPLGATDTGTAAPWAGTANRPMPDGRSTAVWLGVALAALLIGSGIFAVFRHTRAATVPAASVQVASSTGVASDASAQASPHSTAPTETAPAVPVIIGASPITPPSPSGTTMAVRVDSGPTTRRTTPVVPRTKYVSQRPSVPARTEDGIPATRD